MAFSASTGSASELSAFEARKPVFIGNNAAESNNTAASWYTIEASQISAPDGVSDYTGGTSSQTDNASYPSSRAYDRHNHLVTRPTDATKRGYALVFDLQEDTTISAIVLAGHNLSTAKVNANFNVSVYVSSSADFSSYTRLARWTGSNITDDKPLTAYGLGTGHVNSTQDTSNWYDVTSVRYLQIAFYQTDSNNLTTMPQLGEVFIGTRRQLSAQPNLPLSTKVTRSNIVDFNAKSGVVSRYVMNTGQKVYPDLTWEGDGSDGYGLDDIGTLESFFKSDITHGTKPFFYAPDPVTNPREIYFMLLEDAEFGAQNVFGPDTETVSLSMTEVSPFYSSL